MDAVLFTGVYLFKFHYGWIRTRLDDVRSALDVLVSIPLRVD